MLKTPMTTSEKQAIIVVCCSDSRLTVADSADSWRNRLAFDGNIYEIRCPGGGLALADSSSAFYQSAYESYQLLAQNQKFARVILSAHEDCAYYKTKYGFPPSDLQDNDARKWRLIEQAMRNVETWTPKVDIQPVYRSFSDLDNEDCIHRHGPECAQGAERPANFAAPVAIAGRQADSPGYPTGSATQAVLDRFVEERLLSTDNSVEDIMAGIEGRAGERGTVPAWRVEKRAREFIVLLRSEGRRFDAQQLRQLVRAFVQTYAGAEMARTTARALMTSLEPELTAARARWFRRG